MHIRPYKPDDIEGLYSVSLATGLAGDDASRHLEDHQLIGHIYAAPYGYLKPQLTWVAVDEGGVCGYIVGVEDTRAWEELLEDEWWPGLRERYMRPGEGGEWNFDEHHIGMIFDPHRTPDAVTSAYPAHIHLNLLSRTQKKGVGALLLSRWLAAAKGLGIEKVHVAVNRQNAGGQRFWRKHGFADIEPVGGDCGTVWMGRATS